MKNHPQTVMVVCLLRLLSWSSPVNSQQLTAISDQLPTDNSSIQNPKSKIQNSLPCLDSRKECVEQLTQQAMAHSAKLKTLDERIALSALLRQILVWRSRAAPA
jgi:hypothetical protein